MSQFSFVIFPRKIDTAEIISDSIFSRVTYDEIKTIAKINFIPEIYIDKLLKEDFSLLEVRPCDYEIKFSFIPDNSNRCIYELEGSFYESEARTDYKAYLSILKTKFAVDYMYLVRRIQDMADRNQLYDLINKNINSGEIVEVYFQWIHDDPDVWGPPDNTYKISLEDVLSQKKFYSTTSSNDRFIIYKK